MGATGLILLAPGRRTARTIKKQLSVWDAPGSLRAQDPAAQEGNIDFLESSKKTRGVTVKLG